MAGAGQGPIYMPRTKSCDPSEGSAFPCGSALLLEVVAGESFGKGAR